MPPQVSESEVVKTLMKTAGKSWSENRKVTDDGPTALTVPENTVVIAKLTKAYVSVNKSGKTKGKPYVGFSWVIIEPDQYKGQQFRIRHKIYEEGNRTLAMGIQYLCIDLQRLGKALPDGIKTDNLDLARLPVVLSSLLPKNKFLYRVHLSKLNTGFDPRAEILGLPGEEGSEREDPEAVNGEEEEEETEETETSDEESSESNEEEEYEEVEWEPSLKEVVNLLPPRNGQARITKINKTRQVLELKNTKTNKIYKDVPFEEVEPIEAEE